ncbi:MAG: hypothetical protein M9914_12795 [Trueperaceae bacterium]|nr:hypothetical protein [Trueperaceae bacterium]
MQPELSARLAPPLTSDALRWHVAEVEPGGARVRLEPYAAREAVAERLDAACGRWGWSFTLEPMGASALVANLTVAGVTRSDVVAVPVVAAAAPPGGALPEGSPYSRLGELALARCASQFGLRLPYVEEAPDYWVDFDPETGEALFEPEPVPASLAQGASRARSTAYVGTEPLASMKAEPGADGEVERQAVSNPSGHDVIERLVERLNDEGLGKEAAKLVVRYGGYGRTPEESRELYGQLRAVLLRREAEPR